MNQKIIQNSYFGKNLKQIRKSLNITQSDVVRELQLRGAPCLLACMDR